MKKLGTNLKNFNKDTLKSILTKILDAAKALGKKATWMKIGKAIMSGKTFKVIMELQGILNGLASIVNGAHGIKLAKFMADLAYL